MAEYWTPDTPPPPYHPVADVSPRSSLDSLELQEVDTFGKPSVELVFLALSLCDQTGHTLSSSISPAAQPAATAAPPSSSSAAIGPLSPVAPSTSATPSTSSPNLPTAYPITLYLYVYPPPAKSKPGERKRGRPGKVLPIKYGPIDDVTTATTYDEIMFLIAEEYGTLPSFMDRQSMAWSPLKPANAAHLPFHDARGWDRGVVKASKALATQKKPVEAQMIIHMPAAPKPPTGVYEV